MTCLVPFFGNGSVRGGRVLSRDYKLLKAILIITLNQPLFIWNYTTLLSYLIRFTLKMDLNKYFAGSGKKSELSNNSTNGDDPKMQRKNSLNDS